MIKISRSKIELFLECPKCFWLDVVKNIKRPQPAPYTINSAIDYLLKQEFDVHRKKKIPHPVMTKHNIDAIPYEHEDLDKWRHNFTGIQFYHQPTDFLISGAIDDLWINSKKELIVVDYKATGANQHQIYESYRRQMEIYQWLLKQNGFPVCRIGYFVFARVNKDGGFGNGEASLAFDLFIESHAGDTSWVELSLNDARKIYDLEKPPPPSQNCEFCQYRDKTMKF